MDRQLSDFTTIELKAMAYDQLAQMEQVQNNLKLINQELSKRIQPMSNQPQIDPLPPGSIRTV